MNTKGQAIEAAKWCAKNAFTAVEVWAFQDKEEEEDAVIQLGDANHIESADGRVAPDELGPEGIYYVTLGWDSIQGDGHFRVTVRVTNDECKIVDYEAQLEEFDGK